MNMPERLDRVENIHPGALRNPPVKPRDAATLILLDRSAGRPRVLLGKRSSKHVFMPDAYVFPGGRRDRLDHVLPFASDLHPDVLSRLMAEKSRSASQRGARALALAAVRELEEETGLVLGERIAGRLHAQLGTLRYVARAITPPGSVRRFDTRFFSTFADEAGMTLDGIADTHELHDLGWHDLQELDGLNVPWITRSVLCDLAKLLSDDPALPFGSTVPFYYSRRGQFFRSRL